TKLLPRHKSVFLRRLRARLLSCGIASAARRVEDFRRNGETMSLFDEDGGVKLDASTERGLACLAGGGRVGGSSTPDSPHDRRDLLLPTRSMDQPCPSYLMDQPCPSYLKETRIFTR